MICINKLIATAMANLREQVVNTTNLLRQQLLQAVDRLEGSSSTSPTTSVASSVGGILSIACNLIISWFPIAANTNPIRSSTKHCNGAYPKYLFSKQSTTTSVVH